MIRVLLSLIITFNLNSAFALVLPTHLKSFTQNSDLSKVDFKPRSKLNDERISAFNITRAVVKIGIGRAECTGTMVSDDGYLLSAAHCFDSFLIKKSDGTVIFPFEVKVNGVETRVDVVYAPNCSTQDFRDRKCYDYQDLILLKLKSPPTNYLCLPISKNKISINEEESFVSLGYPRNTNRWKEGLGDARGYGEDLYFAKGKFINKPYCEVKSVKEGYQGNSKHQYPKVGQLMPLSPDRPWRTSSKGTLQTTHSIQLGASGGPYINSDLEIVALYSFFISAGNTEDESKEFNDFVDCEGNSFAQQTLEIIEYLEYKKINLTCKDRHLNNCGWGCSLKSIF